MFGGSPRIHAGEGALPRILRPDGVHRKLRLESLQLASGAIPEVMRETRTHDENSGSSAQTFGRISHFPAEPIQWVQDNRRV